MKFFKLPEIQEIEYVFENGQGKVSYYHYKKFVKLVYGRADSCRLLDTLISPSDMKSISIGSGRPPWHVNQRGILATLFNDSLRDEPVWLPAKQYRAFVHRVVIPSIRMRRGFFEDSPTDLLTSHLRKQFNTAREFTPKWLVRDCLPRLESFGGYLSPRLTQAQLKNLLEHYQSTV